MDKPKAAKNQYDELYDSTVESMKALGTYKAEFTPLICRYAEMRLQFSLLMERWYKCGCAITEPYTNKFGATNERKTALYLSIESLRRELLDVENTLGMTPAGMKRINQAALKGKAVSKLDKLFAEDGADGNDMS